MTAAASASPVDPVAILKAFASLRRLAGSYPAGHPSIAQKLKELEDAIGVALRAAPELRIDLIHGDVYADGVLFARDAPALGGVVRELAELGTDSLYIREGVQASELLAVAQFLWRRDRSATEPMASQLESCGVRSISLGRLVPLDTSWRVHAWPDAPTGPLDADYAESLARAEQAFDHVSAGKRLDPVTVRDLVRLLIYRVAKSHAALGQILAVKQYENLTYCHSVNVAMLSLLIGRQLGLGESATSALVEAALLHDIGKTRIPLDIVKKPGALDKRERRLIEAHTTLGAELLVEVDGLQPLTPIVALEHHRGVKGTGYPDVGSAVPHIMSQIVSVADIYEAMTGARSYQDPTPPEHACLVLARLAGEKLNTALVKAFVSVISFFPIGSLVRTDREEFGIVIQTSPTDPLHPVVTIVDDGIERAVARVDTSERDASGGYARHIVATLTPPESFDVRRFLPAAA